MDDLYENIDDYNQSTKRKNLSAFDDMIADIMSNKKIQAMTKELFIIIIIIIHLFQFGSKNGT